LFVRGKFFTRSLFDFPQLYEKWSDFAALRQQLDPHGMFLNPFLRSVFSKQ
jgi:FAD/FMN-containing dehydrogenase